MLRGPLEPAPISSSSNPQTDHTTMGKPIESGNIYTRIPSECCCRGGTPADKVPRAGPGTLAAATPKAPENAEAFDYYTEIRSVLGSVPGLAQYLATNGPPQLKR